MTDPIIPDFPEGPFAHHVRLENTMKDMDNALRFFKDISGAVAVLHTKGKKHEHPHFHIWYPIDKHIQPTAVMNRFKKTPYFMNFKGNKQWSTRPHDSYSKWLQYVMAGCKGQEVILNNTGIPIENHSVCPVCDPAELGTISLMPAQIPQISKKLPMRARFISHCEKIAGWKKGEKFTPENCPDFSTMTTQISDECTEVFQNAFTIPEGLRMVRNAIYVFGDDEIKKFVKEKNAQNFHKAIFG